MKKLKRLTSYFLINSVFAVSVYYGMYLENEGALNIALFIGWGFCAISSLYLLRDVIEACSETLVIHRSQIFDLYDTLFDLCIILAMAYKGYFWLSGFYFWHVIILINAREKAQKFISDKKGADEKRK